MENAKGASPPQAGPSCGTCGVAELSKETGLARKLGVMWTWGPQGRNDGEVAFHGVEGDFPIVRPQVPCPLDFTIVPIAKWRHENRMEKGKKNARGDPKHP